MCFIIKMVVNRNHVLIRFRSTTESKLESILGFTLSFLKPEGCSRAVFIHFSDCTGDIHLH